MPAMSGGSIAPEHRTDFALGGAARVPLGDLKDPAVVDPDKKDPTKKPPPKTKGTKPTRINPEDQLDPFKKH